MSPVCKYVFNSQFVILKPYFFRTASQRLLRNMDNSTASSTTWDFVRYRDIANRQDIEIC